MVLLTTMPASLIWDPLLVPELVPAPPEVPVAPVVAVPLVPVDVPEVPVLAPLVPEDPLLVEPPQATPTATATREVTKNARTGFKTRYLRRS